MTHSPSDLAYLAGIIDGEGCLHARMAKRGELVLRLSVATTSDALLGWLTDNFGGSSYVRPNTPKNRRDCWTWEMKTRDAAQLLPQILPHLIIKRRQAELFIELAEIRTVRIGRGVQPQAERRDALIIDLRDAKKVA